MDRRSGAAEDGSEGRDAGGSARRDDDDTSPSALVAEAAVAISDRASASDHIDALARLEEEYRNLTTMEERIEECLSMLLKEESSLRLAHEQSSMTLRERRELSTRRVEDEAAARLERALMMEGDDGDDSDDSSGVLVSETL
jgi:hypothetical protein